MRLQKHHKDSHMGFNTGLITTMSSTSHGNSCYSLSKGQNDEHMSTQWSIIWMQWTQLCASSSHNAAWREGGNDFTDVAHSSFLFCFVFYTHTANYDFHMLDTPTEWLWDDGGIYFQAKLHCGKGARGCHGDPVFNNRFGLPLAQTIRHEVLLGPGEVMRTPLTSGQQPVQGC